MNSKPHRQNSDFQLRYFLAGDCKTPDGAWCLLYNQKIDMESKLRHADSQLKRRQAKLAKARETLEAAVVESAKLEAEADMSEAEADVPIWELNLEGAKRELITINALMDELEPLRKYSHMDVFDASEASQRDEWLEELKTRAENFLLTQGTIPHDHLNAMRLHPDFTTQIVPFVQYLSTKLKTTSPADMLAQAAPLEFPKVRYEGPAAIPSAETTVSLPNYAPR